MAEDLGYGTTFNGFGPYMDFDSRISTVSGPRAVAVDVARRFTYRWGHWPRSPDRGFDLWRLLSSSGASTTFVQARCREQCLQDERVRDATVVVSQPAPETYRIEITLQLASGPFPLVLRVSELTVELLNEV